VGQLKGAYGAISTFILCRTDYQHLPHLAGSDAVLSQASKHTVYRAQKKFIHGDDVKQAHEHTVGPISGPVPAPASAPPTPPICTIG
jgi:hypothetical protein